MRVVCIAKGDNSKIRAIRRQARPAEGTLSRCLFPGHNVVHVGEEAFASENLAFDNRLVHVCVCLFQTGERGTASRTTTAHKKS